MTAHIKIFIACSCLLLTGCSFGGPAYTSETRHTISDTRVVSNGRLSFALQFMDKLYLPGNETQEWNASLQQPYIDASNLWLAALMGVEGREHHTIEIQIRVHELDDGNGAAGPDDGIEVGPYLIPTSGEVIIGNHTYENGFDAVEFDANIVHELGHVIGIGSVTEDYTQYERQYKGNVFRVPGSKAVQLYNEIYNNTFDFVPISDDGGHLYDDVWQEDKRRVLDGKQRVPPLTKEVMANGNLLGAITLGVLDDIGYVVDYSKAQAYTP